MSLRWYVTAFFVASIALLTSASPCLGGWWCVSSGGCAITRAKCEEEHKGATCEEYPDSFWYAAKARTGLLDFENDPSMNYPNRAQCEAKRKEAANSSFYRSVDSRCRSHLSEQTQEWARIERYAKSVPGCRGVTAARAQSLNDLMVKFFLDRLALKQDPVADSDAAWKKICDDDGYWDVVWAELLAKPAGEKDWTEPYWHGGGSWIDFSIRGGVEKLQREREHLSKMVIVDETLSPKHLSDLRWATANPNQPRAITVVRAALEDVKAVESTMGYHDAGDPLAWVAGHLADPRSACIVELLARMHEDHKKKLVRLDAFAKRVEQLHRKAGSRSR